MNPKQAFANRTARLVAEATTPVYSTSTPSPEQERYAKIVWAGDFTGPDYCHVCGRATEHFGEHSDEQLLAFYNGKGRMFR